MNCDTMRAPEGSPAPGTLDHHALGGAEIMRKTVAQRFWPKVIKTSTCWFWTAHKRRGYGAIAINGVGEAAHRWAYEELVGPIPEGLQLDHLCRNRACVNPEHLEIVSCAENIRRGESGLVRGAQQRAKTHCPQGHPYSGKNLNVTKIGGRTCRACQKRRSRVHKQKRREATQ